jgi:hypothetical protein
MDVHAYGSFSGIIQSTVSLSQSGNGKRHHTPSPQRPRKIKRITFETFLRLKGLFKNLKRPDAIVPWHYSIKPRVIPEKTTTAIQNYYARAYEPSNIDNTRNSLFWQWRRVTEWHRYINDPIENINGHMTT